MKKFRDNYSIVKELAALKRYLRKGHAKASLIAADYQRYESGLRGEQSTDYYLSGLPKNDYYIYRGLRLLSDQYAFQMDTLLMNSRFLLPIETKNHAGIIEIDENNHFFHIVNGNRIKIKSPLQQVSRQVYELQRWLIKKHLPNIPTPWLVVFSNPTTSIRNFSNDPLTKERVVTIEDLKEHVLNLTELFASKKASEKFTNSELKKINDYLLSHHSPKTTSILKSYNITIKDLETGVMCSQCQRFAMFYKNTLWHCPHCLATSPDAHVQALLDYFILIKSTITLKEGCHFLHLSSRNIVRRLFSTMNLKGQGHTRARQYSLPDK
ncbi:hypothetical protein JOD43_003651 [Pullulanibacillus pueri]|nr:nuclease-related domain-containing protein [Pullulanibacillus pueri]MBM7683471.1 hypothetical protein [Pullulanibacillus pueri]